MTHTSQRHFALVAAVLLLGSLTAPVLAADESPPPGSPSVEASSAAAFGPVEAMPDLDRWESHDVPHFAGPADLRISGGRGIHHWDEVRFGAQEVVVSAHADHSESPCVVSLRLAEDADRFADGSFELGPASTAPVTTTLDVDYATATMRVASTCADWVLLFEPLDDPELPYSIDERSYVVRGATIAEILPQTYRLKGKWAAYTEWLTSWQYVWEEADAFCSVTEGSTSLAASVTYPDWRQPSDVDAGEAQRWDRFVRNLRIHELGHVTIALQGADAIDDRLDAGLTKPSCEQVDPYADKVATRILERYNRKSRRYDRDTGHGLTQGTDLH